MVFLNANVAVAGEKSGKQGVSRMTAILFWCGLVIVSSNYLTIPLVSIFMEAFEVSSTRAAWTGSAFSFFYAAGSLFSGPLSDRFGRKEVMLTGLALLGIITLGIGFVQGLGAVVVLRCIQGLAAATFAPVAISYIVDRFPPNKIVTAVGFVSSGFLMSGIAGQIASDYLSQQSGWQSVFFYFGGVYMLTALLVLFSLPKIAKHRADARIKAMFVQFRKVLSRRSLQQCYAITLTLLLSFVAMYTALGHFLKMEHGLGDQGVLLIRTWGVIGMLFTPFAGKLTDRFGFERVLRGGIALAVIGLAMLSVSPNVTMLAIMSVVFVTGIALTVPTLISLIGQLGGQEHGAAVSLYAFILFVGTSIGPLVATTLLQSGSSFLAFAGLGLLLGASLYISFQVRAY